jgi:hypothetical protein
VPGLVDLVVANDGFDARAPETWHAEVVRPRWPPATIPQPRLMLDAVVDPANAHHHDPGRLALAVLRAYEAETTARRRASMRSA